MVTWDELLFEEQRGQYRFNVHGLTPMQRDDLIRHEITQRDVIVYQTQKYCRVGISHEAEVNLKTAARAYWMLREDIAVERFALPFAVDGFLVDLLLSPNPYCGDDSSGVGSVDWKL